MVGDEAFSTVDVDIGFLEAHRLIRVRQYQSGLLEYGLRTYVQHRPAPRAPGTCATSIATFVMRPGTVYEVRPRIGISGDARFGVVNAGGSDIVKITEAEALDILDPPGAIRRKFHMHLAMSRRDVAIKLQRYVFTHTEWLMLDEPFEWYGVMCIATRKTAKQAWIRPCTLREVHPGVPAYPGPPPENPLDFLPERLRPASALAA